MPFDTRARISSSTHIKSSESRRSLLCYLLKRFFTYFTLLKVLSQATCVTERVRVTLYQGCELELELEIELEELGNFGRTRTRKKKFLNSNSNSNLKKVCDV